MQQMQHSKCGRPTAAAEGCILPALAVQRRGRHQRHGGGDGYGDGSGRKRSRRRGEGYGGGYGDDYGDADCMEWEGGEEVSC
jgi:hypothetical protein